MSKTAYHISLKGYVGGYDFDRATVDKELAKNADKEVNMLIDSLGGSLCLSLQPQEPRQGQRAFRRTQCFRRNHRFARRGSHLH